MPSTGAAGLQAEHRARVQNRQGVAGDQDLVRLHLRHPRESEVEHAGALVLVGQIVVPAILERPRVHVRQTCAARRPGRAQTLFEQGTDGQPAEA